MACCLPARRGRGMAPRPQLPGRTTLTSAAHTVKGGGRPTSFTDRTIGASAQIFVVALCAWGCVPASSQGSALHDMTGGHARSSCANGGRADHMLLFRHARTISLAGKRPTWQGSRRCAAGGPGAVAPGQLESLGRRGRPPYRPIRRAFTPGTVDRWHAAARSTTFAYI